jgi:hypothetical protein
MSLSALSFKALYGDDKVSSSLSDIYLALLLLSILTPSRSDDLHYHALRCVGLALAGSAAPALLCARRGASL